MMDKEREIKKHYLETKFDKILVEESGIKKRGIAAKKISTSKLMPSLIRHFDI